MEDRIREIMKSEDFTPARFADTLDIGRAIISHVLNGRNNPSLDLISRILGAFPNINPDWLLFGTGNMYRGGTDTPQTTIRKSETVIESSLQPDLFTQISSISSVQEDLVQQKSAEPRLAKETIDASVLHTDSIADISSEKIIYKSVPSKKVTQIIIYYDDNTYETFNR